METLIEKVKAISLIKPADITTATTGSAIAINLYDEDAMAVLHTGSFTSTPSVDVTIEATAGTSGGSFTTVGTFTQTAVTGGGIAAVSVNLSGKTFARAKIVMTNGGTTQSVPIAVSLYGKLTYQALGINSATVA